MYTWEKAKGSKEKANSAASTTFHMGLHWLYLSCLVPPSPSAQHPPTLQRPLGLRAELRDRRAAGVGNGQLLLFIRATFTAHHPLERMK